MKWVDISEDCHEQDTKYDDHYHDDHDNVSPGDQVSGAQSPNQPGQAGHHQHQGLLCVWHEDEGGVLPYQHDAPITALGHKFEESLH